MKSFSKEWEIIHSTQAWGRYPSEFVVRFVARNYYNNARNKIRILDFGCGAGANTWYLAKEGFDVYAFDGSISAVNKAREYLKKEGYSNVHFSVMDGNEITYEKNFFDCVIDNACIYANKKRFIISMYRQIYEVLKLGGKLFTSCFGKETMGYGTGNCIENGTYDSITNGVLQGRALVHFFDKNELEQLLESVGFKNILIDENLYTDNGNKVHMYIAKAEK